MRTYIQGIRTQIETQIISYDPFELKTLSKLTSNELVVDEVLAFGRKKHGDPKFFVAGNEDRDFQG